jgi:glucuronoarabinoxylan endo-1,4-beta-xylanase
MKFAGVYSDGDSNLMDVYENTYYTSLDFTSVTAINTSAN